MGYVKTIKAKANNRYKGKIQVLDLNAFNSFLVRAPISGILILQDDDGNNLRTLVKTHVELQGDRYWARCSDCIFGHTMAKNNHCNYIQCWNGYKIKDMDSIIEDL